MTNAFKSAIDMQMWRLTTPVAVAHTAGACVCTDLRNDVSRNPFVIYLASATQLFRFNMLKKGWALVLSPALGGTFGAGAGCVFAPSMGLMGSIGAGSTNKSIVTTTTITAVGVNMLANRGGGQYGFRVRIVDKGSGGTGKTEERWIVGNSSGTTPTLLLDAALSFVPVTGSTYEILGGRVFMLSAGTMAANCWKSYEVAANTLAGLSYTNLQATVSTDFAAVALDEQYVPYDRKPGEGFVIGAGTYDASAAKGCLVATAIAAGTITGQASAGDAAVLANEYRNFQIRIVEDTVNVTAVGQRRVIASHTAGPNAVYTLGAAWTVTPSANAKFVIEYPNLILLRSTAASTVYTYNYTGSSITNGTNTIAADAWHVTYFAGGNAVTAGCMMFTSHGIEPDAGKYARHSFIHCFRSGLIMDVLDIAGSITGTWSSGVTIDGASSIAVGTCGAYAPASDEGRFAYINIYTASGISQIFRYDVKNRVLATETPTEFLQTGAATAGGRMTTYVAVDGTDKYTWVFLLTHLNTLPMELLIQT